MQLINLFHDLALFLSTVSHDLKSVFKVPKTFFDLLNAVVALVHILGKHSLLRLERVYLVTDLLELVINLALPDVDLFKFTYFLTQRLPISHIGTTHFSSIDDFTTLLTQIMQFVALLLNFLVLNRHFFFKVSL